MMKRKKFEGLSATTKKGDPTMQQISDNGGMPPAGKYKGTMNEYDHARPKRQVMTKAWK